MTDDYRTPLIIASANGHVETVKILLLNRAKVNKREKKVAGAERTSILNAALNGHYEVAKLLLEHDADANDYE